LHVNNASILHQNFFWLQSARA